MAIICKECEPGFVQQAGRGMDWRIVLLFGLTIIGLTITMGLPRIPQNSGYHLFADRRVFFGIPNFFDIISNASFLLVGGWGLWLLSGLGSLDPTKAFKDGRERSIAVALYLGVLLTGFGSAFYHLAPDNWRLTWDRLPMAFIFGSLLSLVIAERIGPKAGFRLLLPFIGLACASVIYWYATERQGVGDLRPYGFIHFFPVVLILVMLRFFPSPYRNCRAYMGVFLFYGAAVACEALDKPIFALGHIVSGHTLKHVFAALAMVVLMRSIQRRAGGYRLQGA